MSNGLPMALTPVRNAQEWERRVLGTYQADNSWQILGTRKPKRVWRGFAKSRA